MRTVRIAILGFGKIGSGTYDLLKDNKETIEKKTGCEFIVKRILDIRDFAGTEYESLVTGNIEDIVSDGEISVVAEMMGGSHPAYEYTKAALLSGKSVVTSNKEVVANFGSELMRIAKENGVRYLFEASVGGGIPVIRPLYDDLAQNEIRQIDGILNGTTNYILTQMFENGKSFEEALAEAQEKGYAEKDPTDDIGGKDAARKISILASVAFGKSVHPDFISTEGISGIISDNIRHASMMDSSIKLIGHAECDSNGKIAILVSPFIVSNDCPLSHIKGVFNGVLVNGRPVGDVMFYGRGAGKEPTASAVVSDLLDIVVHSGYISEYPIWESAGSEDVRTIDDICFKRYLLVGSKEFEPEKYTSAKTMTLEQGENYSAICTEVISGSDLKQIKNAIETSGISVKSVINIL